MSDEIRLCGCSQTLAFEVLTSLAEARFDGVQLMDLKGCLEWIHRDGRRLLGIEDSEQCLRGASWPSLWPALIRPRVAAAVAAASGGRSTSFQVQCPTAAGADGWWDTVVTPVRRYDGRVVRILATSRRAVSFTASRADDIAASASNALRLEGPRHELLTPLHGLLGMAASLAQTELNAEQQAMLVAVRDCAETLAAVLAGSQQPDAKSVLLPTTEPGPTQEPDSARHVLVVDDNHVNREMLRIAFDALGVSVTTAENGAEACARWETERFDLVIMDLQMPVMDGLTALRSIRAREAIQPQPRTPIVVFTASGVEECERVSLAAGADGFLTKPLSPTALISAITPLLEPGGLDGRPMEARH